jgi:hypothetical protein
MGIADVPRSPRVAGDVQRRDGKELELFVAVVTLMRQGKFCLIFSHARIDVRMTDFPYGVLYLREAFGGNLFKVSRMYVVVSLKERLTYLYIYIYSG